MEKLCRWS